MTAPLILTAYALVIGTVGARALQRARWPDRSPGLGIFAWQALTGSLVLSVILAGAALALPTLPMTADLADLLRACTLALKAQYATPGGAAAAVAGGVLALGTAGRIGYCLAVGWVVTRRQRRRQRQALGLVGHRHVGSGALVVEHPLATAYCVPGSGGQVVLTSAALDTLTEAEVAAVLAHEEAHLRRRHSITLAGAAALVAAFPVLRVFRTAQTELARLVEMHADDSAIGHSDRHVLATALVTLSEAEGPAGTLGAGGRSALARVQRLAAPSQPMSRGASALVALFAATLVVLPFVVAAAPAMVAAAIEYCPVGLSL